MNTALNTPTVLKKILARKAEEVAERSANISLSQLQDQCQESRDIRGFTDAIAEKLSRAWLR